MEKYIKFIIRYRIFVVGIIFLITLISGVILSKAKISGSLAELFLGDSPKYPQYLERGKEFGSDQLIVIAFEEKDLLSKPSINRLKTVVRKIEDLPEVKKATSILDLRDIRVVDGVPVADYYVDQAIKQPERSDEFLQKLRSDPFSGGLLI